MFSVSQLRHSYWDPFPTRYRNFCSLVQPEDFKAHTTADDEQRIKKEKKKLKQQERHQQHEGEEEEEGDEVHIEVEEEEISPTSSASSPPLSERTHSDESSSVEGLYTNHSVNQRYVASYRVTQRLRDPAHNGCINAIAYSEDLSLLATGSDDTTVGIYSTTSWKHQAMYDTPHAANIFGTTFIPNNSRKLVTCGLDGRVCLLDLETKAMNVMWKNDDGFTGLATFPPRNAPVGGEGDVFLVNAEETDIFVMDTRVGRPVSTFLSSVPGLSRFRLNCVAMNSFDPNLVIAGGDCLFAQEWRKLITSSPVGSTSLTGSSPSGRPAPGGFPLFAWSLPKKSAVDHNGFDTGKSRDVIYAACGMGTVESQFRSKVGRRERRVCNLRFDSTGRSLLVNAIHDDPFCFDWTMLRQFDPLSFNHVVGTGIGLQIDSPSVRFKGRVNNQTMFKEAGFVHGDRYVCSGGDCGNLFFWDRETGKQVHRIRGDERIINGVLTHPAVPHIVLCGIDSDAKVVESTGDLTQPAENEEGLFRSARRMPSEMGGFTLLDLLGLIGMEEGELMFGSEDDDEEEEHDEEEESREGEGDTEEGYFDTDDDDEDEEEDDDDTRGLPPTPPIICRRLEHYTPELFLLFALTRSRLLVNFSQSDFTTMLRCCSPSSSRTTEEARAFFEESHGEERLMVQEAITQALMNSDISGNRESRRMHVACAAWYYLKKIERDHLRAVLSSGSSQSTTTTNPSTSSIPPVASASSTGGGTQSQASSASSPQREVSGAPSSSQQPGTEAEEEDDEEQWEDAESSDDTTSSCEDDLVLSTKLIAFEVFSKACILDRSLIGARVTHHVAVHWKAIVCSIPVFGETNHCPFSTISFDLQRGGDDDGRRRFFVTLLCARLMDGLLEKTQAEELIEGDEEPHHTLEELPLVDIDIGGTTASSTVPDDIDRPRPIFRATNHVSMWKGHRFWFAVEELALRKLHGDVEWITTAHSYYPMAKELYRFALEQLRLHGDRESRAVTFTGFLLSCLSYLTGVYDTEAELTAPGREEGRENSFSLQEVLAEVQSLRLSDVITETVAEKCSLEQFIRASETKLSSRPGSMVE